MASIPEWALTEMVAVTAVGPSMALIERVCGTRTATRQVFAITVQADEDGGLLVNGVDVMATETEERIERLCAVCDSVLVGIPVMGYRAHVDAARVSR